MASRWLPRLLGIPERSFFLFGPRGIGKSAWLRRAFPRANYFDLLDSRLFLELARDPRALEGLIDAGSPVGKISRSGHGIRWIVLDEIQKIPALLEEVHRLIETRRSWRFALCGSSARKLRRGGADLLAGRALTKNLEGFSFAEMGSSFNLDRALSWGTLPLVWQNPGREADILESYVHSYIKEEIQAEGLVRKTPSFLRFLAVAGLMNGQVLNASNIAAEAAVPRAGVDVYFSILVDTLLGHFLPAYQPRLKVRERSHPKFYWFDPGVARAAAGLLFNPLNQEARGFALETLIFHELRVFNETARRKRPISHYRTPAGSEIDFVIEIEPRRSPTPPRVVLIEVKSAKKWDRSWEKPMWDWRGQSAISAERMIGVYMGERAYRYGELDILPVETFLKRLHSGEIF